MVDVFIFLISPRISRLHRTPPVVVGQRARPPGQATRAAGSTAREQAHRTPPHPTALGVAPIPAWRKQQLANGGTFFSFLKSLAGIGMLANLIGGPRADSAFLSSMFGSVSGFDASSHDSGFVSERHCGSSSSVRAWTCMNLV